MYIDFLSTILAKMPVNTVAENIQWDLLKEDLEEHSPNELKFHLYQVYLRLQNFYKNIWYVAKV